MCKLDLSLGLQSTIICGHGLKLTQYECRIVPSAGAVTVSTVSDH